MLSNRSYYDEIYNKAVEICNEYNVNISSIKSVINKNCSMLSHFGKQLSSSMPRNIEVCNILIRFTVQIFFIQHKVPTELVISLYS